MQLALRGDIAPQGQLHEDGHAGGVPHGELRGDAKVAQEPGQRGGHVGEGERLLCAGRRSGGAREPVSRQINGDHMVPLGERAAAAGPRVGGAAGAVEEEHGGPLSALLDVPADRSERVEGRDVPIRPVFRYLKR
jgi:hypothetical protein